MTLQQLEYIVAVFRYRHFAKAADYCNVTQPTLSSMVQKLEDELGVKIFDRKTNPITVTPAGKLVIEQAWRTLQRARRVKETVEEQKHSLSGTVNIGILPTIAPYLIPRFFPQMMDKYPDLKLKVSEMKTSDIARALLHDDIDAAIVARHDELEGFDATPLFYERYFAYVAESDQLFAHERIKVSDLNGEYLWLLDEGHCFRDQLVKFCKLKSATVGRSAYSLGSIETFMRIVESGKGVTFIPELATLQLTDEQRRLVRPFAIPVPSRNVLLLTGKHFIRHTLRDAIVQEIQAAVPREMLRMDDTQKSV